MTLTVQKPGPTGDNIAETRLFSGEEIMSPVMQHSDSEKLFNAKRIRCKLSESLSPDHSFFPSHSELQECRNTAFLATFAETHRAASTMEARYTKVIFFSYGKPGNFRHCRLQLEG